MHSDINTNNERDQRGNLNNKTVKITGDQTKDQYDGQYDIEGVHRYLFYRSIIQISS